MSDKDRESIGELQRALSFATVARVIPIDERMDALAERAMRSRRLQVHRKLTTK